jgi:hypothetical protein
MELMVLSDESGFAGGPRFELRESLIGSPLAGFWERPSWVNRR